MNELMNATPNATPMAGFSEPVHDAQRVFRHVLDAMAHPGKIVAIDGLPDAPAPLNKVSAAICLSLVDFETPLWTDTVLAESGQALAHLKFHCGCPITSDPKAARTAVISTAENLKNLERYHIGTDERPDLSTTVIVQAEGLSAEQGARLTGPGIATYTRLDVLGAGEAFWSAIKANTLLFPRGVDVMVTTDDAVVCLPRTTQVEI